MLQTPRTRLTLAVMSTTLFGTRGAGFTYAGRVAAEVRAQMARLGVTQTELASALATTQAAVSRRLSGTVPFDVVELAAIAGLLGCSMTDLLPSENSDGPDPVSEVRARHSVKLPRLDSNQEPSVLMFPHVRGWVAA